LAYIVVCHWKKWDMYKS